jgi:hypothetical protein
MIAEPSPSSGESRRLLSSGAAIREEAMTDSPKIFFMHIRKTAGTSIVSLFTKEFEAAERCPIRSELELRLKVPNQAEWKQLLTSYRFVGGHFYRIAPLLIPEGFKVVTILRDPLDRGISAFNHIKNDRRDPLNKIAADLSFHGAIAEPKLAIEFRNPQARFLLGNAGYDFESLSRGEKVERALDFLKRIDFFGFHELLNQAGQRMGQVLGMPLLTEVPHLNRDITAKGVRRTDILKDIAAFEAHNMIDREIYTRALQIYDQRFA